MRAEDLRHTDLNLLVYLQLLLEEQNVGRAARRAGISASAMSRALSRLREQLGDPLLVPRGRGLTRSARSDVLLPNVRRILEDVRGQVLAPERFDPPTAEITWTLAATDSTHELLGGTLVAELRRQAPRSTLRMVGPEVLRTGGLGSGKADLAIGPRPSEGSDLHTRTLFAQNFRTLAMATTPGLAQGPDGWSMPVEAFARAPHGLISPMMSAGSMVDDALEAVGMSRRVFAVAQHFAVAPQLVRESELLVTLPSLFANRLARDHDLVVFDTPLALPTLEAAATWHGRQHVDLGHTWFRELVYSVAHRVGEAER